MHTSARLASDLLTTDRLNAGFQNICPMFQKLKILIGPFHPKTTHDSLSLKDKSCLSCVWVNQNSWTTMCLLPLEAPEPSSSPEHWFGLTRLYVSVQLLTPQIKLFVLCGFDTNYRSTHLAIPGNASGKEPTCLCRGHKRYMLDPWVGKISWRRPWQPTPVFLSGEFHGQMSLGGYSPRGHRSQTRLSD